MPTPKLNPFLACFEDRIEFKRWELVKYATITFCMLLPCVGHLFQRQQPAVTLYVSDHGENLNDMGDNNYGHGTRALTPYELKVPFVFYFNDAFLGKYPETAKKLRERRESPVCHDHITHTLMGLAGISDPFAGLLPNLWVKNGPPTALQVSRHPEALRARDVTPLAEALHA